MSDDLIKRSDAIDAMRDTLVAAEIPYAVNALFKVPSADRPQGEWKEKTKFHNADDNPIIEEWQSARCSVCGKYHTTPYLYYFDDYNYCPNCGAKMKGADDERL